MCRARELVFAFSHPSCDLHIDAGAMERQLNTQTQALMMGLQPGSTSANLLPSAKGGTSIESEPSELLSK